MRAVACAALGRAGKGARRLSWAAGGERGEGRSWSWAWLSPVAGVGLLALGQAKVAHGLRYTDVRLVHLIGIGRTHGLMNGRTNGMVLWKLQSVMQLDCIP